LYKIISMTRHFYLRYFSCFKVQEIDDNNSSSGGPADPIEALKKDVEGA